MKRTILTLLAVSAISMTSAFAQGKFSGYMFGDYYYNVARDASFGSAAPANAASGSAATGATAMQAFQLRRVYFTYDNDISEQFTTRFRLEADQAANASNGKIGEFVKDAYLKWKGVFSGSDLIFGLQPTPAFDISETAWGYRSLEKTIMDLRGVVSARDQGIALRGKLVPDGMVNYWLMIGNNSANSPATTKYKRYYATVQVKPASNLQATLYADYRDAATIVNAFTKDVIGNAAFTGGLFAGYNEPGKYNVGVEGFFMSTANGVKDTLSKSYSAKSALGVTVYGSLNLAPDLAVVARFDNYNPSTDTNSKDPLHVTAATSGGNLARNYIIAGLDWKVNKNVSIIPNVLYETYEAPTGGSSPDPSVTARITFYYIFL